MELRGFLARSPFAIANSWTSLFAPENGRPAKREPRHGRLFPAISVVIPAHNEERYLGPTLCALHEQTYRFFEIIVVANGCTDETQQAARGRCHRVIVLPEKNLGKARNLGARMAYGDLLLFLDADTILEPMALKQIAEDFSPTDAAGTLHARPDSNRLSCWLIYQLKNFMHRSALHPGSSGVIICWKDQFLKAGRFDEGLEVRENSDLIKRLKRFGRYKFIGDVTAITSMRRYEQRGVGRVLWLWCRLWFQSLVGDLHHHRYEAVR